MSNIGTPCVRKLWIEKNHPEEIEQMLPSTYNKFAYGDILEEWILFLAHVAGHKVEGRQDEQSIAGIKGHRDAVIDGVVVDVKSASSFSFQKFKNHLTRETDSFGYIPQLMSYVHAGQNDPIVTDKSRGAFLAIDKQNGTLCLDFHKYDPEIPWEEAYENRKSIVNGDKIPDRLYRDEPDGYKKDGNLIENGNRKLGIECSYCHVKHKCWPELRTFLGSTPKYLTHVEKLPRMIEVDKFGNKIDND